MGFAVPTVLRCVKTFSGAQNGGTSSEFKCYKSSTDRYKRTKRKEVDMSKSAHHSHTYHILIVWLYLAIKSSHYHKQVTVYGKSITF